MRILLNCNLYRSSPSETHFFIVLSADLKILSFPLTAQDLQFTYRFRSVAEIDAIVFGGKQKDIVSLVYDVFST